MNPEPFDLVGAHALGYAIARKRHIALDRREAQGPHGQPGVLHEFANDLAVLRQSHRRMENVRALGKAGELRAGFGRVSRLMEKLALGIEGLVGPDHEPAWPTPAHG